MSLEEQVSLEKVKLADIVVREHDTFLLPGERNVPRKGRFIRIEITGELWPEHGISRMKEQGMDLGMEDTHLS